MPYKDPEMSRFKAAERAKRYREKHPERVIESRQKWLTLERKERLAQEQRERLQDPIFRADKLQKERVYQRENRERIQMKNTLSKANMKRKLDLLKMGRPCYDCGGIFPPGAMDWDHLPGTKKCFGLGRACSFSLDDVIDEINKCQLVCACCHRIRTQSRRQEEI